EPHRNRLDRGLADHRAWPGRGHRLPVREPNRLAGRYLALPAEHGLARDCGELAELLELHGAARPRLDRAPTELSAEAPSAWRAREPGRSVHAERHPGRDRAERDDHHGGDLRATLAE